MREARAVVRAQPCHPVMCRNPEQGADPDPELERLFVEAIPEIEAACQSVGRKYRVRDGEMDDLQSMVKLSIITGRYRVLVRFQGRCSFRTYLRTVVLRLFLDNHRKEFGKWRPSARAKRHGALAVTLERLIYRHGLTREEAVQQVALNHSPGVSMEALHELAAQLPARLPRWRAVSDPLTLIGLRSSIENPEDSWRHAGSVALAQRAIEWALIGLSDLDLLLLRLRYEDDMTIADIARTQGLKATRLYRRMESTLEKIKGRMGDRGVAWSEVASLLDAGRLHIRWPDQLPDRGASGNEQAA